MKLKRLFIYLGIILASVMIIDVAIGYCMKRYIRNNTLPGDYRSLDYLVKDFDNELLVMGSSVALNSLNTAMMSDSLSIDAYNGASNGQTFSYQLVLLKTILQRKEHLPKMIILGMQPSDLMSEGVGKRINLLSPYYNMGYQAIDSVLDNSDEYAEIFMKSSMYRYNTIWFRIFLYNFMEPGIKGEKGFIAKDIPPMYPTMESGIMEKQFISDFRKAEMNEFMKLCRANGIRLILFFPPQYYKYDTPFCDTALFSELRALAGSEVEVYNDISREEFLADSTLFYDNAHLNINGANKYTDIFIDYLKEK